MEQHLNSNPFNGSLHVFVNRRRDKIKALYWHRSGFCLWYKRLEKERFAWPIDVAGETCQVSLQEFQWLVEGFDLWRNKPHASLHYSAVT